MSKTKNAAKESNYEAAYAKLLNQHNMLRHKHADLVMRCMDINNAFQQMNQASQFMMNQLEELDGVCQTLAKRDQILSALEAGGVDNWDGYHAALSDLNNSSDNVGTDDGGIVMDASTDDQCEATV